MRLPPLPQIRTKLHDAATAGAAPPRAHRVSLRIGALPPLGPFASRGTWLVLTPAGGGRTVPPRPPVSSLSLFLLSCRLPTIPKPGWRGGGVVRVQRRCGRCPTTWRLRAAPPPP